MDLVNLTLGEMRAIIFGFDCYLEEAGLNLPDCQLMLKMLHQYIEALEKTSEHGAIRVAYGQLEEYLKYQHNLIEEEKEFEYRRLIGE